MNDLIKSFRDYVRENGREYNLRIKTVVPLGDKEMEYIERVLSKYIPLDITSPVKTIIQKHPLDFQDIQNAEVWIVDVTTELPVSAYILQQELRLALNIPEKYIVVRSANDPLEVETQKMISNDEIDMAAMEKGLSPAPRLSTNSSYDDDELHNLEEPVYGDDYNKMFLDVLAKVAKDRIKMDASPASPELNQGGIVKEVPDTVSHENFNAGIDSVQPISSNYANTLKNLRKHKETQIPRLSTKGNYDDDEIQQTKKYDKYGKNKKVAVVTIKNERKGIRKSK